MHYEYKTSGTCSQAISLDINDNIVTNVHFLGGCPGNTVAVAKLVEGLTTDEVIARLEGIPCASKKTSCGDQLAKAVREACANA